MKSFLVKLEVIQPLIVCRIID